MNIDTTIVDKEEISPEKMRELAARSYANKISNSTESNEQEQPLIDPESQLTSARKKIDENNNWFRICSALILAASFGITVIFVASFYNKVSGGNSISNQNTQAPKEEEYEEKISREDRLKAELAFAQQEKDLEPEPKLILEEKKDLEPEQPESSVVSERAVRSMPKEEETEIEKDPLEEWARLAAIGSAVGDNEVEITKTSTTSEPVVQQTVADVVPEKPTIEDTLVSSSADDSVRDLNQRINQGEIARIASVAIGESLPKEEDDKNQLDLNNPEIANLLSNQTSSNSYLDRKAEQYRQEDKLASLASSGVSSSQSSASAKSSSAQLIEKSNSGAESTTPQTRLISDLSSDAGLETGNRQVSFGTVVEGELSSSIVWSESIDSSQSRTKIILNEPLLSNDGSVALEAGASLIAEVTSIQNSGLTTFEVIAVSYVDSNGALRQEMIPAGTISIRGKNNKPLMAEQTNDSNGSLSKDILFGVLGAGERGFEVLNEPSESTYASDFGGSFDEDYEEDYFSNSVSTRSNENASLLTGAAEGAFGATKERLEERNEQTIEEQSSQTPIYQLEAGTSVSIFVNSFLEINK